MKNACYINPLSANPTKRSNTLKQFVGKLPTNCLSVFDHFMKLALKGLKKYCLTESYFEAELEVWNADVCSAYNILVFNL